MLFCIGLGARSLTRAARSPYISEVHNPRSRILIDGQEHVIVKGCLQTYRDLWHAPKFYHANLALTSAIKAKGPRTFRPRPLQLSSWLPANAPGKPVRHPCV